MKTNERSKRPAWPIKKKLIFWAIVIFVFLATVWFFTRALPYIQSCPVGSNYEYLEAVQDKLVPLRESVLEMSALFDRAQADPELLTNSDWRQAVFEQFEIIHTSGNELLAIVPPSEQTKSLHVHVINLANSAIQGVEQLTVAINERDTDAAIRGDTHFDEASKYDRRLRFAILNTWSGCHFDTSTPS